MILDKKVPIEDATYTDIKYVQEACGAAYLAILKALDEYLVKRGVDEKELPQSVDDYREMIKKYAMIHDGKRCFQGCESIDKLR